ncbi:hypothetical protein EYF80_043036 [Liparis tanakae]|uniref:Uncharacterized protein n=1 Tax=Liparis tanakae TaxID=230148 RepID=A0A4Z2G0G5_9TELE|nr:hypothetical protein EYF80_043036 [Liparis tanakae]
MICKVIYKMHLNPPVAFRCSNIFYPRGVRWTFRTFRTFRTSRTSRTFRTFRTSRTFRTPLGLIEAQVEVVDLNKTEFRL